MDRRVNPLVGLRRLGQGVWLDNLSRALIREGGLARLVAEDGLSGVTSNPSIFHKAIAAGGHYRDDLARMRSGPLEAEARYEALVIPDIQAACDLLRPVYDETGGDDGYVSLEVSPRLAGDEDGTVRAALRLRAAVARDNVLIKVPATPPGARAVRRLIAQGVSVNVTLMFSIGHVLQIEQAYVDGVRLWLRGGGDPRRVKSVASLFLSRVDTLVDGRLEAGGSAKAAALRGRTAVAMAKLAYQRYLGLFHGAAFADLAAAGARPQYLLWASTGTKDPRYSDVLYVEPLIGPETVNTLPDATLAAFRDHGTAAPTLEQGVDEAEAHVRALGQLGIDMDAAASILQADGVRLFDEAYASLLKLVQ